MTNNLFTQGSPLIPEQHTRLVQEADNLCSIANIPKYMLGKPLPDHLPEIKPLKNYRKALYDGFRGVIHVGSKHSRQQEYQLMTAWLMRNFVDARFMNVDAFLENPLAGEVVLIPRLVDATIPAWKLDKIANALLWRAEYEKFTVIHEPRYKQAQWSGELKTFVAAHYLML